MRNLSVLNGDSVIFIIRKEEAESQSIRDEEQRKLRRRQQMGGTVLTSPLGTSGGVASTGSSLLGRMG